MNLQVLDAAVLRATLLDIPEIRQLLTWQDEVKVFWGHVEESVPLPYVVMNHFYGSEDNQQYPSRATDTMWKVVGVSGDLTTAANLANAISKLHRKMPVCDNLPAVGYTHIVESMQFFERLSLQNFPIFMVGAYYRLRLSLGE